MRIAKYTKEGIFLEDYFSITEAANQNNVTATNIGRVINGARTLAGEFQWRKTDSSENISPVSKPLSKDIILQIDIRTKQILNTFSNAKAAASYLGISSASAISACASHQILPSGFSRETAHGYIWEWKDKIVTPRVLKVIQEKTEEDVILYKRWAGIKARCYNENDTCYYNYGALGVTMCAEWTANFESFKEWALLNGFRKELEIDKDILCEKLGVYPKIYSPETCLWVTRKENIAQQVRESTSKIVYQYSLEGTLIAEYKSIAIASAKTNIHHRAIARTAKLERGTAGGYLWRFEKTDSVEKNRKITKQIKQIDRTTKVVIAIYEHIDDAVLAVNGSKSTIYSACNKYGKSAYGYIWEYV